MSATNKTTNYELPVFVGTDKPAWLVDWNGAMNDIDTAIKEAKTAGDNAQTTANTATSDISTLSGSVSTLTTSVSTLATNVSTNTGSINTITSLIGNGEPTTTDKTIIGAINELAGDISAETASDISYDNTTSGLTATDVQSAIDELASGGVSGTTYSTSEVDTGDTWVDGKHIFRKCFTASSVSYNSDQVLDATLTNTYIDKVIEVKGGYYLTSDKRPLGIYTINSSNNNPVRCLANVETTGLKLKITDITITGYDVIIEYTKADVTP